MRILLTLLLLGTSLPAAAQDSDAVFVWGAGTTSCGQLSNSWRKTHRTKCPSDNGFTDTFPPSTPLIGP